MTSRATALVVVAGFGLLLLSGCAVSLPNAISRSSALVPLRVGDIVRTGQGDRVDFDSFVDDLARADVVYVGETHVSAADHEIQKRVAQALFARRPSLALALEMFPREAQGTLDRYGGGELTRDAFLKEVEWEKTWGFPFSLYEPILTWAKEKRIKVVGLNAPQEVVRKVSRGGIASLHPDDRSRLAADFDLSNRAHRKKMEEEFSGHLKGSIRDFEAFYEAQLAWEETMAETIAGLLKERKVLGPVLVLIGKGHIGGRFGVPERAVKRFAHQYRTVVPAPVDYPETLNDRGFADFVWITAREDKLPPGRLGVLVRQAKAGSGLEVISIHPESPADRAGIVKGDIILAADGQTLPDIEALHRAVGESSGNLLVRIKRKTKVIDLPVTLVRPSQKN